MAYQIGPLREDELQHLSRFLAKGFGADPEALFAAPDVLRWKYLAPRGEGETLPRSLVARDDSGAIVGHVGWVPTRFLVAGAARSTLSGVHMIDWLGSTSHPGVGGALLRRVNALADVQYGLGGTGAGRAVIKGAGFVPRPPVPVYQSVLRPGFALRDENRAPLVKRALRAALGFAEVTARRWQPLTSRPSALRLDRVESFGAELDTLMETNDCFAVASHQRSSYWNALLQFPRGSISGWRLTLTLPETGAQAMEFAALLSVVARGRVRVGKIIELVMARDDVGWRRLAYWLSRDELQRQGADFVLACGSTTIEAGGLRAAGFRRAFELELSVRDRGGLLPNGAPLHVSFMDADYAYLP